MNIAIRKLALLEKKIEEQEELKRIEGYVTNTIDNELRQRVSEIILKVKLA